MPRTGAGAHALTGNELTRLIWIWLASGDVGTAVGSPPPAPKSSATSRHTQTRSAFSANHQASGGSVAATVVTAKSQPASRQSGQVKVTGKGSDGRAIRA
jgi:hypothetical protein